MDFKTVTPDDSLQELIKEVLAGFRDKLLVPLISEINRLALAVGEMQEQQVALHRETRELLGQLEKRIAEAPVVTLSALRDALRRAGEG
ncbi:hypothetical protein [Desulfovirgula thermocuniculi]|uniref:hypothetical protein n=1 Tax=Desulfovirgula thermocuniculi TaxID=348842 RepID=UPI00041815C2|nr:hypothetical protein [Desulfovirgula thermocuniculi]